MFRQAKLAAVQSERLSRKTFAWENSLSMLELILLLVHEKTPPRARRSRRRSMAYTFCSHGRGGCSNTRSSPGVEPRFAQTVPLPRPAHRRIHKVEKEVCPSIPKQGGKSRGIQIQSAS